MAKVSSAPPASEPLAQLELVHAELNRQIDATIDKHRTMFQRSSLLIGAATVVTGVQAGRIPAAIHSVGNLAAGLAELHVASVLFAVLATGFALIAALHGTRAIMTEVGGDLDVAIFAHEVLDAPVDLYSAEWSLVRDKIEVHQGAVSRLQARREVFARGATFLVVSWILAILEFVFSAR
jgi:hypothetical protein